MGMTTLEPWTSQGKLLVTLTLRGSQSTAASSAISWDQPSVVVSWQVASTINEVVSAGLFPLLWLLGTVGNVLSAMVFYRQGLRVRINLCLFCLALADLGSLAINFLLRSENVYRQLVGPSDFIIRYCLGLAGVTYISLIMSAVIACERCYCVVYPLTAQLVVSTRQMAIFILVTSVVIMALFAATVGPKHTTALVTDTLSNHTLQVNIVTKYYEDNKTLIDLVDRVVLATGVPLTCLILITLTTSLTAVKLQQASVWRRRSAGWHAEGPDCKDKESNAMWPKEVALTRMLIVTSVLFIACILPQNMLQLSTFLVDLQSEARYSNLSVLLWALTNLLTVINNSFNFFIYCAMGSKFRETLREVVCCCARHSE